MVYLGNSIDNNPCYVIDDYIIYVHNFIKKESMLIIKSMLSDYMKCFILKCGYTLILIRVNILTTNLGIILTSSL